VFRPLATPGQAGALTDIEGIRVGHATLEGAGRLTGTTVVVMPAGGAVAGVDVRGAAPGTRETDLLDPGCLVDRVHAIVLSGGSAFGLATAEGVMDGLYAAGHGWPMGAPGEVVPIVPAAVIFDLGRGGDFRGHPTAAEGAAALAAAGAHTPAGSAGSAGLGAGSAGSAGLGAGSAGTAGEEQLSEAPESEAPDREETLSEGRVGAGTGARAGSLAGGLGSASTILPDGSRVAALVVVNAIGSPVDPRTGELLAAHHCLPGDLPALVTPDPGEVAAYAAMRHTEAAAAGLLPGGATTIGVIATDATLTKAGCRRLAGAGHDGLARALAPVHTMLDGDTLFAVATGARPEPCLAGLLALHEAAAACVTRAVARAVLAATSVTMWPGTEREQRVLSYLDAFPSARDGSAPSSPTSPTC
jgi:L-aminopeptidase/D-esterase-like protein